MTVTIDSSRFGSIEIPDEGVIDFPSGLIGIEGRRYALISQDDDSSFVWLHSLDDPTFALPVMNPWRVFVDYEVEIGDGEAARIGLSDPSKTSVYVTVRATGDPKDCSVNLRAPILISEGRGFQVINEFPLAPLRAPLFPDTSPQEHAAPSAAA